MGYKLGKFLGGIAKTALPFTPAGPAISVADSIIRKSKSYGFGAVKSEETKAYFTPTGPVQYDNKPMAHTDNVPQMAARGPGCAMVWDGTRYRATHPNKSTYVTRCGGTSKWPQQLVVHPKGTECVTRRKMNAGNGRAAVRAVRRLVAFYGLSQRVAKQLRKAASRAHIRGGRRGQKLLPRGGGVEVVNVE